MNVSKLFLVVVCFALAGCVVLPEREPGSEDEFVTAKPRVMADGIDNDNPEVSAGGAAGEVDDGLDDDDSDPDSWN